MGVPADFPGANFTYGPPPGREETVGSLRVFKNGRCIVSAWDLTDDELDEIIKTRRVFLSSFSGDVLFPVYVGSETTTRSVVLDSGPVWHRGCQHDWYSLNQGSIDGRLFECRKCGEQEEMDVS